MTIKLLLAFAVSLSLVACGGTKADDTTTPSTPTSNTEPAAGSAAPTGDGVPCEQEIALECPEGQIDGCLKTPAEGTTHACVAQ